MTTRDRHLTGELTLAERPERLESVSSSEQSLAAWPFAPPSTPARQGDGEVCRLGGVTPGGSADGGWARLVAVRPALPLLMRRDLGPFAGGPIVDGRRGGGAGLGPGRPAGEPRRRLDVGAGRPARLSKSAPASLRGALIVSAILHLTAALVMVPWPGSPAPLAAELPPRQVEMVFISQPPTKRGAPSTSAPASPQPLAVATAASPLPPQNTQAQPSAAPTTPGAPTGPVAPHWQTSMLDDVGNAPADEAAYSNTSDDIRPTRPDSAYRNMPPRYPEDAARHGQRGVVDIIVHVTPDGRAGRVEVAASSGVAALDHSAVEALSKFSAADERHYSGPVPVQDRGAL